jgi:hypothetical protein
LIEMSNELYSEAALSQGKSSLMPKDRRPLGLRSWSGFFGEEKNLWPMPEIEAKFLKCKPIT